MSVRLLQLSDPHFGTERPEVVASLLRCVRAIAPDLVVLSGDITQRATRAQFAAAAAFVAALAPLPVRVVPGNHDIPLFALATRLLWPYRRFAAAFGVTEPAPWTREGVAVLFMDSTSRWRHRHGVLAPARARARLAAAAAARVRVVVLHHPTTCRRERDEENIVRPGAELVSALAAGGADLVLGGHIHDPHVELAARRYPGLTRSPVLAVAGTCVSDRTRADAPNSFNLVSLSAGAPTAIVVERWDHREAGGFAPELAHRFVAHHSGGWRRAG
ncbi:metallophosphoesterase family protein [Thauera phenolivorans]|uniref:metallophosphoesterase family protein n=1 Tax=Thauera phenolivorans TaxID=1792543 RepID=UPI00083A5EA4|nr:metallophosphoesterase [Thauera phenolivorans]